ncbi:MAG: glycosyltransferase [Anditalea sp.]
MKRELQIAFFGSSLVSAYWNGAATYYRGIIKTLHHQGHSITFYEPDVYGRQANRDIPDPEYAKVVIYQPNEDDLSKCLVLAKDADIIIKASGVGIFDRELEERVLDLRKEGRQIIFWDVDAPATLDRMINVKNDYFKYLVPKFDQILTYGGGQPVEEVYKTFGARECTSIYNAFDSETHYPVSSQEAYTCDLAFLGNRLPDRESRVEKYFIEVAEALPDKKFILGGSGWGDKSLPKNIKYIGHVPTRDHNAFNCSPLAVLNISRDSMATYGFSPATRVFEAAGAGACIITDAWNGISEFFQPKQEILVANSTEEVKNHLLFLGEKCAKSIGEAALKKALNSHTYGHRAQQLEEILQLKNNVI